jgi:hypothetical protein
MHPDPTKEQPDAMRQEIDVRYVVTTLEGEPRARGLRGCVCR